MAKTVGIVGVGTMGSAMARNLIAAGFKVVGRDIDPARADALAAMGGSVAGSPRAVAQAADCVLTSLPSIAAFEAATGGADGIGAADRSRVSSPSTHRRCPSRSRRRGGTSSRKPARSCSTCR